MQKWTYACAAVALATFATAAKADVVLNVAYALPSSYKSTQEEIAKMFEASHPGIKVVFRAPLGTYDDVISDLLRSKVTGGAPDVAYVGMNHIGLVADRGVAVPLDGLAMDAKELDGLGYYPSILSLGRVGGKLYGVPFAVSLPVLHANVDLVEKAGGSLSNFSHHLGRRH